MHYVQFFTDGSKDPQTDATGPAVVIPSYQVEISKRTSDYLNVYTDKLLAMLMALEWAEQVSSTKTLICSVSVSTLTSIKTGASIIRICFMNACSPTQE